MIKTLSPGAIGIRGLALPEAIKLASKTGFSGLDFSIREAAALAETHGLDHVRTLFDTHNVRPAVWGLPFAWNQDAWQDGLLDLPRLAEVGRELGCTRTATWCPSWSDERDFEENYAWHLARFRPIAEILARYDCQFGIEFLGPKTLRTNHQYEFIHTMDGMLQLAEEIGTGNVGLLLDAYHLYTAGGSVEDIDRLSSDDVVYVHINDAPAGLEIEEQIDQIRCLPLETGVIDLPTFMRKLHQIGYEGPVTTEPFNKRINELASTDPEAAAREVSTAMDQLWTQSGLR